MELINFDNMGISKKDVEHIADLARIKLSEEEKTKFTSELSAILDFVEKLNEVDTSAVEPMAGGTLLQNETRLDKQTDLSLENKQREMLLQVPDKKEGWIKVRAIFE